ncbi:MAG: hypothetical protein JST67_06790 [Bacteroidetes bacterium]|nr:hypothetical protein [Bacteroidota bacterium]
MHKAFLISGFIFAALFMGCGFALLCTSFLIEKIPEPNRTWGGFVFIAYGAFRLYRQIKTVKSTSL